MKGIDLPKEIDTLLGRVFDNARREDKKEWGREEYARRRQDFIFHMTDWLGDLKQLNNIFRRPQDCDPKETTITVMGVLYHVIPHLKAAGRLLLDEIPDAFEENLSSELSCHE
ncbi:MAG: hypothetical protein U0793_17235 [Gemmataceae bacterium]